MQKNLRQATLALLALASLGGCASAKLRPGGIEAASGPMQARFQGLNSSERADFFDQHRLSWDGWLIATRRQVLSRADLKQLLADSGAPDLASASEKASPALVGSPPSRAHPLPRAWDGAYPHSKNDYAPFSGNPEDAIKAGAAATAAGAIAGIAIGAVAATAGGAYIGTKAIIDGIWSDLNPNPSLEDVLEAYNQRLAFALGLNYNDAAMVTSAPRPYRKVALIARDQQRGRNLVKAGIGLSMAAMGIASGAAFYAATQHQDSPKWAWPTFAAASGALLANLVLGWTVVW